MFTLLLALATVPLLIWVILTFFRGGYWQIARFDVDLQIANTPAEWPRVLAVVPARNEAQTIERAVESLLRQDYPGEYQVLVVDDHSEDRTAAIAHSAAQFLKATDRLRIVPAKELPPGWTGKLWAIEQGVEASAQFDPDYYWFTDADITHSSDTLGRLIARAETDHLDLTSLMVLLQAKSFPERLLIPPFLYFFLKLYPPFWIASPTAKTAGAAGGCALLKRTALERIGGVAAIKSEVIDDCALARAVKGSGGSIWMGLTRNSISLRTYSSFSEIRDLIARTAFTQLRYSTLLLVGTLAGMLLTYLAPFLFSFSSQAIVWRLGLTAWALCTITYLPTLRFYGLSPLWAPTLPFAAAFYSYSTCISASRYWLGSGGQWKGRSQAPSKQIAEGGRSKG